MTVNNFEKSTPTLKTSIAVTIAIILIITSSVAVGVGIILNLPTAAWPGLAGVLRKKVNCTTHIYCCFSRPHYFNFNNFANATKSKRTIQRYYDAKIAIPHRCNCCYFFKYNAGLHAS